MALNAMSGTENTSHSFYEWIPENTLAVRRRTDYFMHLIVSDKAFVRAAKETTQLLLNMDFWNCATQLLLNMDFFNFATNCY